MSVWVIEQGEYSDYRVVGVYSSRENAERIAEKINAEAGRHLKGSAPARLAAALGITLADA